jgi:hypothetical protein
MLTSISVKMPVQFVSLTLGNSTAPLMTSRKEETGANDVLPWAISRVFVRRAFRQSVV